MKRFGFIHDKLDIKILTLFVLNRLGSAVDLDTLTELVLCDDGISYFDFSECVAELQKTDHIRAENGLFHITEKGIKNGQITENSIPYTVRRMAEEKAAALSRIQQRNALVKAEVTPRENGGFTVHLSLDDGLGEVLSMELYTATEPHATAMTARFSKQAEEVYGKILALLAEA
ncbi:MAG: DUF4364 family protein [Oscillospiraceae bacterium]|nr:DUF4364 family protein [Oscillospiraceae bacterium]